MQLDSFFFGALCVMSGGRLPAALFMVFLLDSKDAEGKTNSKNDKRSVLEFVGV